LITAEHWRSLGKKRSSAVFSGHGRRDVQIGIETELVIKLNAETVKQHCGLRVQTND
jgi:hypothetical protein